MWTVLVPIQPVSSPSLTKGKNKKLIQYVSDISKLKFQFKRLFQKIKLTSQVANTSKNKKHRNISQKTLKFILIPLFLFLSDREIEIE